MMPAALPGAPHQILKLLHPDLPAVLFIYICGTHCSMRELAGTQGCASCSITIVVCAVQARTLGYSGGASWCQPLQGYRTCLQH